MHDIDGAYGEGGGQLVRTACALAAITGQAVRLRNVRARRDPPGLAPQHLTAVKAVGALCGAGIEGLAVRSRALVFKPGSRARGGRFDFDVGTAGCLPLVLQALLPVALAGDEPVHVELTGGTDIRGAPPLDYLRFVLLPLLAAMGARIEITVLRRGYYPRGGGRLALAVRPGDLRPLRRDATSAVADIRGIVHVANLPAHIAARMHDTAARLLGDIAPVEIAQHLLDREGATGPGAAIALWASGGPLLLGAAEVARRGVPAERIATTAAQRLRADIAAGATLDIHAADQILVYAALARGASTFLARALSPHARTALWLLGQLLDLRVQMRPAGACTRIEIESLGGAPAL